MFMLKHTALFNKFLISLFFRQPEFGKKKLLSKENLLLRGCVLRNTDYIEGIVIYAGKKPGIKFPRGVNFQKS